jgi:hypothetical protein
MMRGIGEERWVKPVVARSAYVGLWVLALAGLYFSVRWLPPMHEKAPWFSLRYGQNWVGQGGWAAAVYACGLLALVYSWKRCILTHTTRQGIALLHFILLVTLSLPYIWFFVEMDWFNLNVYRVSCWVGTPIMVWLVPTVSFLIDLSGLFNTKSVKHYLIRSAIEVAVVIPIWTVIWIYFEFSIGWAWI